MTDQEINIAIAQVCGWKEIGKYDPCRGISPQWKDVTAFDGSPLEPPIWDIPDYVNDHSAIYNAEKYIGLHDRSNLELRVKWVGILRDLVAPSCPLNKVGTPVVSDLDILTADSRIKALALVQLTKKKKRK